MLTCFMAGSPGNAMAQQNQNVPAAATRAADPGRAADQLRTRSLEPSITPKIEIDELKLDGAPDNATKINLSLKTLTLEGVSVYSDTQLRPVYEDKLGQTISLADVYRIAADLTRKYRNDGYILTRVVVPPQTIESGAVRLQVVEGTIDSVLVEGEDVKDNGLIRQYANRLTLDGGPVNVRELERILLLINDLPGVSARSVLSPADVPGAAVLRILIERDPYDAFLSMDNFGSRYLGQVQGSATGSLNNVFGLNERLSAQAAVAPDFGDETELQYGALSWDQAIGPYGTLLQIFTSYASTEPGYTLEPFDVEGKSFFAAMKLNHPFVRTRALNVYGHAAFDYRNVKSENNIEPTREDRIRALRLGGRAEFLDTIFGAGINTLSAQISHGLGIFGHSEQYSYTTRDLGDSEFLKIEAEVQRLQRITNAINLLLATKGQLSSHALLSSEEFGVGGPQYGRGYDPSEIVGDDGFAAKIEFQWDEPIRSNGWPPFRDYQLFGFYDFGRTWNKDATTSADKKDSIASAGIGLRTELAEKLNLDVYMALPLTREVETRSNEEPRYYFSLTKSF